MIDVNFLFDVIGPFGFGQVLFALYLMYGTAWQNFTNVMSVFTAYIPAYRCHVPPLDDPTFYPNLTEADIVRLTSEYNPNNDQYDGCRRYGFNLSECVNGSLSCVDTTSPTIKCDLGFSFSTDVMEATAVSEYDLICDNLYLNSLSNSIYYVGMLLASIVCGNLCDNIGRMRTNLIFQVIFVACIVANAFSSSYVMYLMTRFGMAIGNFGSTIAVAVLATEATTEKYRTKFFSILHFGGTVGYMVISGVAYYWRDWRAVTIFGAVATSPFLLLAIFLHESPRWLATKGKLQEFKKALTAFGKMNGIKLNEDHFTIAIRRYEEEKKATDEAATSVEKKTFLDLFRSKRMVVVLMLLSLNWFTCSFVYYGISLNAGALNGDIFVNNTLNGLVEIGAYTFLLLALDKFGRRNFLVLCHLIAGLGLLSSMSIFTFTDQNNPALQNFGVVLAFVAKFGITACFGTVYQYTTELFPTTLRSNGFGFCSTVGRLGSIIAPFLIDVQQIYSWLPNTIFGAVGVMAGLSTLFLPDTLHTRLLRTEEDALYFYKHWKTMGRSDFCPRKADKNEQTNEAFDMNEDMQVHRM